MCEKPSNYLVLESQFSNGLKLFIVLLSTSPQRTLQPVRLRNCSGGALPRSGLQGARGGCKQFSYKVLFQHSTVFCCWQTTSHSQTSVCCCRSVQNSFGVDRAVPAAARGSPRSLAAAVASGPARSLQPIHSRTECLVHLFIRNNQKH